MISDDFKIGILRIINEKGWMLLKNYTFLRNSPSTVFFGDAYYPLYAVVFDN